jgi:hypothetical protein
LTTVLNGWNTNIQITTLVFVVWFSCSTAMIMWEMLSGNVPWANMIDTALIASVSVTVARYAFAVLDHNSLHLP